MVASRQDIADDALDGAACWLVGFEHDVDAGAGDHLAYCGYWRMPPSIHLVNVLVFMGEPLARNERRVEMIWVANAMLEVVKFGGGAGVLKWPTVMTSTALVAARQWAS